MNYIKRDLESDLLSFLNDSSLNKDVLLVAGARQVGKSTIINHVLKSSDRQAIVINLEKEPRIRSKIDGCIDFKDFTALLRDEFHFDPSAGNVLFIDESQESLRLGEYVRFMKEEWNHASVILTGSTLTRLFREGIRYPVGRVRHITMTPLSFGEFLRATGDSHLAEYLANPGEITPARHEYLLGRLDDYLGVGGLPAVVIDFVGGKKWRERRESVIADLEQDFIRIFGEETYPIVKACLRSVAHFVGNPSKHTTVIPGADTRLTKKIGEVFSRLEAWHLVLLSNQYGMSAEHSFGYHPKRYLYDTGILRHLREMAVPSLRLLDRDNPEARTLIGGIIENQVAIDLSRNGRTVAGWKKTSAGNDIDFIVKIGESAWPMECKASLSLKGTHLRGTLDYLKLYKIKYGFIMSAAPYEVRIMPGKETIVNIPLYSAEFSRKIIAELTGML
jgi:predicted AAA+ superfamily ATPase